ncbi:hypothetical protein [Paenibacillus sp. GXUN7292]|uniref:hypothetical protein n=1 Tax=Paenibacillus sp. GXUN7292 TaxID=3422499 RepID=UPI003D7DF619
MSDAVRDLLKESHIRGYVQVGYVTNIKPVRTKDMKYEVVEINFRGVSVYCRKEEFTTRNISSLGGFLNTPVPFLVTDINDNSEIVQVSRIRALPIKLRQFQNKVKVGDIARAIVTGTPANSSVVYVDIDGMPAMIRPGEWGLQPIRNLSEVIRIGAEIDVMITDITPVEDDEDWEFAIKVYCSRRQVLVASLDEKWSRIDEVHTVGENVVAKVVGKLEGRNNYLIQIVSSNIVIFANMQRQLAEEYRFGLPQGMLVHAEILRLNKEDKRGKARIFRIDPSYQTMGSGRYGSF